MGIWVYLFLKRKSHGYENLTTQPFSNMQRTKAISFLAWNSSLKIQNTKQQMDFLLKSNCCSHFLSSCILSEFLNVLLVNNLRDKICWIILVDDHEVSGWQRIYDTLFITHLVYFKKHIQYFKIIPLSFYITISYCLEKVVFLNSIIKI